MTMAETTSSTWKKVAEIPMDDMSIEAIYEAINQAFGEDLMGDVDEIESAIKAGYIEICDDGIIIWVS